MWSVPQAAQRGVGRGLDVGRRTGPGTRGAAPTLVAMTTSARLPRAASQLPMTVSDSPPSLPGDPGRVGVGGVDEVAARGGVRVEHGEGLRLVGGPAEDVAAEGEREDLEVGRAELAKRSHGVNVRRAATGAPSFRTSAPERSAAAPERSEPDCQSLGDSRSLRRSELEAQGFRPLPRSHAIGSIRSPPPVWTSRWRCGPGDVAGGAHAADDVARGRPSGRR